MATEVLMPQMGESIAEGTITKWLVKVGDQVERDQPLFEISTDKVDAEIPSPASGILLEIKFQEGETVAVNKVVALIGEKGEKPTPEPPKSEEPETPPVAEEKIVQAPETAEEPQPSAGAAAPATKESKAPPASQSGEGGELEDRIRRASSPVVRKIAAEHGVDISQLEGTGIHGRVTKKDILSHIESGAAQAAPSNAASVPAPRVPAEGGFSVPAYTAGENVEIVPMSKIRQITAAHMRYSKSTSAHVTTLFHMDMTKVDRARRRARDGFAKANGTKLTYMPFIFKAVCAALKANPKLNASIDGTNIVFKKDINLGMAVALDWGLIVPVIKNADQLSLVGLAKAANDLAERARSKKLKPEEVQGGTFTITNPGVFGSLFGTPVINQPQVGILGIGVIEKRAIVETDADGNDTIAIKPMSYFAITYDHRLVDGADADHFMNDVKRVLLEETWSELDPFL